MLSLSCSPETVTFLLKWYMLPTRVHVQGHTLCMHVHVATCNVVLDCAHSVYHCMIY